jgi:hypothetical protein
MAERTQAGRQTTETPQQEKISQIGFTETLREGSVKRIGDLRTGDIYKRLVAKDWELPTTFRECKDARRTWEQKCRDPKFFKSDRTWRKYIEEQDIRQSRPGCRT